MMNFLKTAWARVTASKVAWMVIPMAAAQIYLAITGVDVSATVSVVAASLFGVLELFLTVNNPADQTKL